MEKDENISIYPKPGYLATDTRVVIGEYYQLESDILPCSPQQLEREIIIKQGATVAGNVCGRYVIIGNRAHVLGSIICENARISPRAKIEGGIYASNEILVREDVKIKKDLTGGIIKTGDKVQVDGHVYGNQKIIIGNDNIIKGVIYSEGDVTLGDYCDVRDISSHENITLGDYCLIRDDTFYSKYGNIKYGEGLLLLDLDENIEVPIEDSIRNFRRDGVEYSLIEYSDAYYYVHGIDEKLQNNIKTKHDLIKNQLTDLWKFDLPIKENQWKTTLYSNEIDFNQVRNTVNDSWITQKIPRITRNIFEMIEDVGKYYFDIIRGIKSKDEPEEISVQLDEPDDDDDGLIIEQLDEFDKQNLTEDIEDLETEEVDEV